MRPRRGQVGDTSIWTGIAILALAVACAYGWRQGRNAEQARAEAALARAEAARAATELAAARAQLREEQAKGSRTAEELRLSKDQLAIRERRNVPGLVSIGEICAVPERYTAAPIAIQAQLANPVQFADPATHFMLHEQGCYVLCAFKTAELDPDARRMLQAARRDQSLRFVGRLVPEAQGVQKGVRTMSGYQFVVMGVERPR